MAASRFPFVLIAGQFEVERLLHRRALEAGVTFRYGTRLVGLRQEDDEGVDVDVTGPGGAGEHRHTLRASYLIGADGVRSTVRDALGLPFPGRVRRSAPSLLADVRMAEPAHQKFLIDNAVPRRLRP